MDEISGPHIEGMSQETLTKFLKDMHITEVVFYGNPQAIHLFLSSPSLGDKTRAMLTITACDDLLTIALAGTSGPYFRIGSDALFNEADFL